MSKIQSNEKTSKKEVIIRHAATLFRNKGYKTASMRELASVIGIEAASLYNHIQSKSELLYIICFQVAEGFTQKISEIEQQHSTTLQKVEELLRFHTDEMINKNEVWYVSDREWRNLAEPALTQYRELRRNYRQRFTNIIQKGMDDGELKSIDANTTVMVLLNAIQAVDQWHRIVHKVNSAELKESIINILLAGIKA